MSLAPAQPPNSICQDVAKLDKQPSGVKLTFSEKWELALINSARFNFSDQTLLGGFSGVWKYYKGAATDQVERTHRALRCYSFTEDKEVLTWRYFHEVPFPNGFDEPTPRQQDGLYDSRVSKRMDDPYFSFIMRITVSLPAGNLSAPRVTPHDGLNDSLSFERSRWGVEAFLDDTLHRWTMGPIYDSQTLRLVSNFLTKERYIRIRPSEAIDMDALSFPELRPMLPKDPGKWLEGGQWEGLMSEVIWDDDGEMLRLRTRPAIWSPPDAHSKDHKLIRYEDAMYGFYPTSLPSFNKQDQLPTYKNVVRFEFGGLMRVMDEFRRILLRYKVDGTAESLAVEWYRRTSRT